MLGRILFALSIAVALPGISAANPSPAAAQRAAVPDAGELINESGRLRMLSERMGKAYAQLALGLATDKAREQIAQSQKRFAENLAFIERGAVTSVHKVALDTVRTDYAAYVKALAKPADKDSVAAVHRITEKLVSDAENLTAAFEGQARVATAKVVNVSGRQRMLSQRMARLYFAAALGNGKADVERDRAEFNKALAMLEAAPLSSPEIRREIDLAKTQWVFFEQALQAGAGSTAVNLVNVATTSERLLETMDNLTALYSKSLKYLLGLVRVPVLA